MEHITIEECCDILDSRRIPITASERRNGRYPYYGANGIQDYVADYIFDDELVLLAEDGGNFGSKTRPIAYRVSGKCWVNNHAHVLKPMANVDVDYLCYSLMFYDTEELVNGATRQKLTQAAMRKMLIPQRPITEQKKIVSELSKIQSIISVRQQQLQKLDELVKSRFVELFGDCVLNSKGWKTKRLGDIAEVGSSDINPILRDLITEICISIVVLAEYTADINDLIRLLYDSGVIMEHIPTVGCDRIHILGRIDFHIEPQLQTDYASIQVIGRDTILCCVHLNSQIYSDHVSRREIVIEQIINDILKLENGLNTTNTIIVGDFNINPYDNSCVNARYFHGIPIYEDAMRESRNIAGKEFRMFYNPMWNFLGDFKEPYGTYYRSAADTFNPYWHIYDQVIIRPSLRSRFVDGNLKIITGSANVSLLDKNKHPNHSISDHLPITFEIKEDYHEQNT